MGDLVQLGFLTACLPAWNLERIAGLAAAEGFTALEVSAWPASDERPFTAAHVAAESLDPAGADRLRAMLDDRGLTISALAYYENNLHYDDAVRAAIHDHVRACVDAAVRLGCPAVGTFVGRDITRTVVDNLREGAKVLPQLVDYAGERGVRLVIENCPMEGWHPDAYPANLAYSPELWDWLIDLGMWLNYDPSHLVGLGIDPVLVLRQYVAHVAHVQAKDIEVFPGAIDRYGFFGKTLDRTDPWDHTWWRFRVPGRGHVDWNRIVDVLAEGGYDGAISVEHEDPVWGGTDERVVTGLQIAHRTLAPLVVGPGAAGPDNPTGRSSSGNVEEERS
jgi:sugar phosphate isomerase/epimerase